MMNNIVLSEDTLGNLGDFIAGHTLDFVWSDELEAWLEMEIKMDEAKKMVIKMLSERVLWEYDLQKLVDMAKNQFGFYVGSDVGMQRPVAVYNPRTQSTYAPNSGMSLKDLLIWSIMDEVNEIKKGWEVENA